MKRILSITFLAFLFTSCKENVSAENRKNIENSLSAEITKDSLNVSFEEKNKQDEEIFQLEKPIKTIKGEYEAVYNGYKVLLNSNSNNQELTFFKNKTEIKKVLNFYYENGDIVFKLYKSNLGNLVLLIEGRDYYSSNLGIYYIDNKSNSIIEIDDTLVFRQEDPEKLGVKDLIGHISKEGDVLKSNFYLGDKFLYEKKYNIQKKIQQSIKTYGDNWLGIYQTQINKNSNDTNTMHIVSLKINKDSIIFEVNGYHVSQKYLLGAKEVENKLKLEFIKDLSEYNDPQIEKIQDFGVITFKDNIYMLRCPYIDLNFGYGLKQVCVLKKDISH
jgi:hypothetical protein